MWGVAEGTEDAVHGGSSVVGVYIVGNGMVSIAMQEFCEIGVHVLPDYLSCGRYLEESSIETLSNQRIAVGQTLSARNECTRDASNRGLIHPKM